MSRKMLLPVVFFLALGGTNVAAELAGKVNAKLPWGTLYTSKLLLSFCLNLTRTDRFLDTDCTPVSSKNNDGYVQWSELIDISTGNPWKNEEPNTKHGFRRRSLWLPAKPDSKHRGNYCFEFFTGADGTGEHDTAQVRIEGE
jgi:hypothetical protein